MLLFFSVHVCVSERVHCYTEKPVSVTETKSDFWFCFQDQHGHGSCVCVRVFLHCETSQYYQLNLTSSSVSRISMDVDHEIQLLKEEIKRLGTPGLYGGSWFLQLQILFSVWRCLLALCKTLLFKLLYCRVLLGK